MKAHQNTSPPQNLKEFLTHIEPSKTQEIKQAPRHKYNQVKCGRCNPGKTALYGIAHH